jgi:hypothetical protein
MQNDEARMAEVEAAYNSILMMNMQRRLSGSIKADASIQNADNVYVHRPPPSAASLHHPPLFRFQFQSVLRGEEPARSRQTALLT